MKRKICNDCQRPEKSCICRFITLINNDVMVVVLQHPSEVKQTKGTVTLLSKSLVKCKVVVGENFTENNELNEILQRYQMLLLYPSTQAEKLSQTFISQSIKKANVNKPLCLLILDGTWKKAYRMMMLSTNLHHLPQVCLPEKYAQAGQYSLRKVNRENALSSLEACCYALSIIEDSMILNTKNKNINEKYRILLNNFVLFNDFQLSFRPE